MMWLCNWFGIHRWSRWNAKMWRDLLMTQQRECYRCGFTEQRIIGSPCAEGLEP